MNHKLKVFFVHNYYQFRGGEDEMAEIDTSLLRKKGHEVLFFSKHNNEIKNYSVFRKAFLLFEPTFSLRTYREALRKMNDFSPDVIHINNFFPLISPSVIYAGKREKIPVVMSLHDFRLICANGLLLRKNAPCEKCFINPIFGLIHKCYRDSRIQTLPVTLMISIHRFLNTWRNKIDLFISPSEFVKKEFIQAGFDPEKIFVRPNYVEEEFAKLAEKAGETKKENYAIFVGRLSEEKGIRILLSAWDTLRKEGITLKLKIAGDGQLADYVKRKSLENDLVEFLGFVKKSELCKIIAKAKFLVVPSICYEVFGRAIIEAFACRTPVLGSKIGAIKELIVDGENGLLFEPKTDEIVKCVKKVMSNQRLLEAMSQNAYRDFQEKYTEERAYKLLIEAYSKAIELSQKSKH